MCQNLLRFTALILTLQGCAGLELNPLTNEHRVIHPEQDRTRTLSVTHEPVLEDKRQPAHELRLPPGISTRSVPAAVYIDGEGTAKVLIWKLGEDFMGAEGRDWRKSF